MLYYALPTILVAVTAVAGFSTRLMATPDGHPDSAMLREAALQIDRHVAEFYRDKKFPVPPVADDAKFLRRTFLTVVGRVPTHDETTAFLESDSPIKRQVLVASLLDSPGYGSHMTNWIFDLIRLRDRNERTSLEPYRHWVRTAMDDNMPWDTFTRRLLASHGSGWQPENAAVGYYVRDRGMPHDNLSEEIHALRNERQFRRYFDDLVKEIQQSYESSSSGDAGMSMQANAGVAARRGLIRAADLPSPAPRGHFLHVFGQSDREVVDASSREPNVGQVLSLMNGFVQKEIIGNPESVLFHGVAELDDPEEKITRLCLTILSRPPTDAEMEWMLEEVRAHGATGVRNLAAALVMSSEFLFLQ